jgi:hypothetical protein
MLAGTGKSHAIPDLPFHAVRSLELGDTIDVREQTTGRSRANCHYLRGAS